MPLQPPGFIATAVAGVFSSGRTRKGLLRPEAQLVVLLPTGVGWQYVAADPPDLLNRFLQRKLRPVRPVENKGSRHGGRGPAPEQILAVSHIFRPTPYPSDDCVPPTLLKKWRYPWRKGYFGGISFRHPPRIPPKFEDTAMYLAERNLIISI